MKMDNYPCPDCKNGDVLVDANPKCTTCGGSGSVVRPKS